MGIVHSCRRILPCLEKQHDAKKKISHLTELKENALMSTVAAGHEGAFLKLMSECDAKTGVSRWILKKLDRHEAKNYQELLALNDSLLKIIPQYGGVIGAHLKISNLLCDFQRWPHVLDMKLGARSFVEEEVNNTELRQDLFRKFQQLDPSGLTPEENERGSCTKYRWMNQNDVCTTLRMMCFRADGIANSPTGGSVSKEELQQIQTIEDAAVVVSKHLLPHVGKELQQCVVKDVLARLVEIKEVMRSSSFLTNHSLIGSSFMFIINRDGLKTGVYLIDLAKTTLIPKTVQIDHMSPWVMGNYEDGIFLGVDNVIRVWEKVIDLL